MDLFWEKSGWEEQDKHLLALKNSPFRRPFPELELNSTPAFYVLRGPRQVGKSSWLKTILSNYGRSTEAFYLSCENIESYRELSVILQSIRSSRSLILLDEVSFVKDWSRAVKHELDSGYAGIMIVTGSHAADLRAGADTMPGRFGSGRELTLLPMDFAESVRCRQQAGWPELSRPEQLKLFFKVGGAKRRSTYFLHPNFLKNDLYIRAN